MSSDRNEIEVLPRRTRFFGWTWLFVFAMTSVIIQWRLVLSITTHISYGSETAITVPLLNLWTVWWNADRAADGFRGYADAPIFFPTRGAFAFSEMQPTSIVVAPIIGLTGNRALAYNVYQLLILTLNGFSSFQLLRRIGHIRWLAFCGGIMSQILPFAVAQSGAIQLTTLLGIYWTISALLDLLGAATNFHDSVDPALDRNDVDKRSRNHFPLSQAIRLGLAYGLTYWLCNYWGLFLFILVIPSSVWLWNRRIFNKLFWRQVIVAGLVASVMVGPLVWLQCALSREHAWQHSRTQDVVHDLSADVRDYTDVPSLALIQWLEFPDPARANVWELGAGGMKLLLLPLGLIASLLSRQRWRWGLFAVTFGALAFGLSLGPTMQFSRHIPILGTICPYELLQQWFPGFSLIRSPFRFAMFVQIAMVWMSIEALDLLNPSRWIRHDADEFEADSDSQTSLLNSFFERNSESRSQFRHMLPLLLVSALVTIETVPRATTLFQLPVTHPLPEWVTWVSDQAKPGAGIACLPFPTGFQADDYEATTIWMFWGTYHRHPLVNGYSGFFPYSYCEIKDGLEEFQHHSGREPQDRSPGRFSGYAPDNVGLLKLNQNPVSYLVVKRLFATPEELLAHPAMQSRWAHVFADQSSEIDVYQRAPGNNVSNKSKPDRR